MLKVFLWLRYLAKKKIVFLSIAAVAVSVSLLIVVASLFTGFINAFELAAVEAIGDVVLSPPPLTRLAKYPLLIDRLEQTEAVEAATAMMMVPGLLHVGKGTGNVRPVDVWGIEPGGREKVTGFKRFLLKQKNTPGEPTFDIPGSPEKTAGFVGIGVLAEPNEQTDEYDPTVAEEMVGTEVFLTTGTASEPKGGDSEELQFKRRMILLTITDIQQTGVYQFDEACVYLPIEKLHKSLYPDERSPTAGQVLIKLADGVDPDVALAVIRGVWRNFVVEELEGDPNLLYGTRIATAKELQRDYVAAYRKQMGILLVIFGVVSIGVILLIFCIFYMIVRLKQKDIAIIKSCGATSLSVAFVFVGFGACVGAVGSGIGAILGYMITRNINIIENWIRIIFGLKLWRSSVYFFSKIPNEVDWFWAGRIVVLAVLAAAIGTLIPAIVAARTKPVEILRYE
jgi:ABC-type lipoprotein release transport system permease subunit